MMNASECLKKKGDMAISSQAGCAFAIKETPGRVLVLRKDQLNGTYGNAHHIPGDDWQPLLTEEEWQEKNSFLRKPDPKEEAEHIRLAKELAAQTVDHFAKAIADVGANAWQPLLANPVGERLTEAPEVGYAILINQHMNTDCWRYWSNNTDHGAGWLEAINEETTFTAEELLHQLAVLLENHWLPRCLEIVTVDLPKKEPEKPEPPKWLGAVRCKTGGVAFVTHVSCNTVCYVWNDGRTLNRHNPDFRQAFTLAPDIMPPSPELAALFGESEVKNGNV